MPDADPLVAHADSDARLRIDQQNLPAAQSRLRESRVLPGADLEGADLAGVECAGTSAAGVMLRRAGLSNANFEQADLRGACLDEATLDGANLTKANLTRATFRGANLAGANLTDAKVTSAHFGGSDCSGAVLPASIGRFDGLLSSVTNSLDAYRKLLFKVTGFVGYTLLTVLTTSDLQIVLNNAQVKLPLLSVGLPIRAFFLGASGLSFLLFVYLHVGLDHACRLIARLPATLPDGLAIADKLELAMLGLPISPIEQFPSEAHDAWTEVRGTSRWRRAFTVDFWRSVGFGFIAWIQLPALTVILWARALTNQREFDTYLLMVIAIAACTCAIAFRRSTLSLVSRVRPSRGAVAVRVLLWGAFVVLIWSVARSSLTGGNHWTVAVAENTDISQHDGREWRGAYLNNASLRGARFGGSQLGHAHLEKAQLQGANLVQAGLERASMRESNLGRALLMGANLASADLRDATLVDAAMNFVNLSDAQLERAALTQVRLDGARLTHAKLSRANLSGATLTNAHLEGAVLTHADLEQADLSGADLEGADLSEAKLSFAGLEGASLRGAKLHGATLEFARGVNTKQLCSTEGWREALLPDEQGQIAYGVVEITKSGSLRPRAAALCPE